ncbi:MAG: carbon-nitrogen hydrolase family protein [Clostridium sp.]
MQKYMIALIQMDSQNDKGENLRQACAYLDEAASHGVKLVCFPEVMNLIGRNVGEGGGKESIPGYTTERLQKKAKEHGIYIQGGSITEEIPGMTSGKTAASNTSVLISPQGEILAAYRKLHMFDITLADGTPFNESDKVRPGQEIVTVSTELGMLGMSICYDIRFPEMYRIMALRGAQIIFAPASFTMPTGKDHWEPLLRARAIENGCYIVAAGQIGNKPAYTAYGNSMVVDPWGTVIARAKDVPGITYAEIDLDYLEKIRGQIPSLKNRRSDLYEVIDKTTE